MSDTVMRIDILTLFPEMCERFLNESIIGRARAKGVADFFCHNIRDYTESNQGRVDDAPFGGGTGLVMQIQPILSCHKAVRAMSGSKGHVIYMSPQGRPLTQERVKELSRLERVEILCGHYEGVDERALELIVDEEISVGDFVVTGGELPALMLTDAITRMLPGTLRNEDAYSLESHYDGLLEYPQYTRPWSWRTDNSEELTPPEVLRSGHHAKIKEWQKEQSILRTRQKRPDLWRKAVDTGLVKKEEFMDTINSNGLPSFAVHCKLLKSGATMPRRATDGSAGYDLYACIEEDLVLESGGHAVVPIGIAIALPSSDMAAFIFARSGLAVKHGVVPANAVGVIDSDYRGEILVGLINQYEKPYTIKPGERIAQMVIMPVLSPEITATVNLSETQRGMGGFGSTGQ